ncbi:MAG TPA: GGDEF domain-containing protein [Acidobacteriaceae bacterium]|jgi:diguanylate cyclase (GGDEF)-like protein|nr:GGDEF domain-containing protein [Acidobacteriaceae bacterium]
MLNYAALPDLIALAALVLVFRAMLRRHSGERMNNWLLGWIFILVHFTAQLLDVGHGAWEQTIETISLLSLEMGGIAFIRAGSRIDLRIASRTGLRIWLAGVAGYTLFVCWNITNPRLYYAATAALVVGVTIVSLVVRTRRSVADNVFSIAIWWVLAVLLTLLVYRGKEEYGIDALLAWIYLMAGVRYWQHFWRKTTGVLTAVGGFFAWAAVFPVAVLQELYAPHMVIESEVWNIPKYIVAVGILLTLLEEQIERAEHLALHDALTGLPNRRLLEDRLEKALERAERNHTRAAVLLIDLDGFKQINDNHGHAVGDNFLRAAAQRLHSRVRKADTIARTGGDEFTIIISDMTHASGAEVMAEKLQEELDQTITVGPLELRVSGSIGVAVYPDDAQTAEDLCAVADASMYASKRRGKAETPGSENLVSAPAADGHVTLL